MFRATTYLACLLLAFSTAACTQGSSAQIADESKVISSTIKALEAARAPHEVAHHAAAARALATEATRSLGPDARRELLRRSREVLTPALQWLVEHTESQAAATMAKGRESSAATKTPFTDSNPLATLPKSFPANAEAFPPTAALLAYRAMLANLDDEKELVRLVKVFATAPYSSPENAKNDVLAMQLVIATKPLRPWTLHYPEFTRWALHQFYTRHLGQDADTANQFAWHHLFMNALPSPLYSHTKPDVRKTHFMASLQYAPLQSFPRNATPPAHTQAALVLQAHEQMQRRWNFFAQVPEAVLCDPAAYAWREPGMPYHLETHAENGRKVAATAQEETSVFQALCKNHKPVIPTAAMQVR